VVRTGAEKVARHAKIHRFPPWSLPIAAERSSARGAKVFRKLNITSRRQIADALRKTGLERTA